MGSTTAALLYSRRPRPSSANPPTIDEVARGGELGPARDRRPVGRLGERARLVGVAEHVSGRGQLGQHHDPRAGVGRRLDRAARPRAVAVEVAEHRRELAHGDAGVDIGRA